MKKTILIYLIFTLSFLYADWTIEESFSIPEGASGLAYDGEFLYCGIYGANGDEIYQINPENGDYSLVSSGLLDDCFGLTYDGNYFWTIERLGAYEPSIAIQFSLSSEIISQFELPTTYMSGMAYDDDTFWTAAYYDPDGQIYHLDNDGAILSQFSAPDDQPWDLCLESEYLWMVDYWGDAIYKIDKTTGEMIESYDSESTDPAGIVFDGTFLWYCDNGTGGTDTLYKINLAGGGTAEIHLESDHIDFGQIAIEDGSSESLEVTNNGSAILQIDSIQFTDDQFSLINDLPIIVEPDSSNNLIIECNPFTWGAVNSVMTIESNDPVNPTVAVELQGYSVFSEEEIEINAEEISFGDVRVHAQTGRFIEISNQGIGTLEINSLQTNLPFFLEEQEYPFFLATRDTLQVRIWFEPEETIFYEDFLQISCNDTDESEIELEVTGNSISFNDEIGTELWEFQTNEQYEKVVALQSFIDITGDDVNELLVADNRYHLFCLNGNSSGFADVIWEFNSGIESIGYGSIYDKRGISIADDLNNDGIQDIVIGTAWGSRSIFALNGYNGEILWFYDTDAFGDGGWVYQVEAKRDFNYDSISDVLAVAGDDESGTGPKAVFLFDGTNGELLDYKQFDSAQAAVISLPTIDYDGTPEIICSDSSDGVDAKIHYLNSMFNEIFTYNTNSMAVWALKEIQDITNDGFNDIAFGTFYGAIGTITHSMDLIWEYNLPNAIVTRIESEFSGDDEYLIPVTNGVYSGKIYESTTGSVVTTFNANGVLLDIESIADQDNDGFFDVITGSLANQMALFSGNDGTNILSINYSHPVDQVSSQADINQNQIPEILVGLRNGNVKCLAGANGITYVEHEVIPVNIGSIDKISPNPFNPETEIHFTIKMDGKVNLDIYNIKGQKVVQLIHENLSKGQHTTVWNGIDRKGFKVSSGIYFISLTTNGKVIDQKKCMLLK